MEWASRKLEIERNGEPVSSMNRTANVGGANATWFIGMTTPISQNTSTLSRKMALLLTIYATALILHVVILASVVGGGSRVMNATIGEAKKVKQHKPLRNYGNVQKVHHRTSI